MVIRYVAVLGTVLAPDVGMTGLVPAFLLLSVGLARLADRLRTRPSSMSREAESGNGFGDGVFAPRSS
jgi:hypothetical protein